MRILHVIPFLWSGAGNVVTRLCESQSREHEAGIVTSGRSKGFTDWPEYRKRLKSAGVRHFEIDFFDRNPEVFWPSVEDLSRAVHDWWPDIIHCHSGVPACAAALIGHRFIAQLHSWGVGRPSWMNTMDLWGFRQAVHVLCGSRAYERILIDGGVHNVTYLPWGVEKCGPSPCPLPEGEVGSGPSPSGRGLGEGLSPFLVGFLGRIEPRKGQLELARAYSRFQKKYPESRLELAGPVADKEYEKEIRLFIRKNRLAEAVKLTGRVAEPCRKMRAWNLFTSLSSDEGQGLAILEAMALGVPVLARRVAGVEDYLEDRRTGFAVKSSSPGEVADRIEWAFHNEKELMRVAARAKRMVETRYNWETMLTRMNSIYEAVQ